MTKVMESNKLWLDIGGRGQHYIELSNNFTFLKHSSHSFTVLELDSSEIYMDILQKIYLLVLLFNQADFKRPKIVHF